MTLLVRDWSKCLCESYQAKKSVCVCVNTYLLTYYAHIDTYINMYIYVYELLLCWSILLRSSPWLNAKFYYEFAKLLPNIYTDHASVTFVNCCPSQTSYILLPQKLEIWNFTNTLSLHNDTSRHLLPPSQDMIFDIYWTFFCSEQIFTLEMARFLDSLEQILFLVDKCDHVLNHLTYFRITVFIGRWNI